MLDAGGCINEYRGLLDDTAVYLRAAGKVITMQQFLKSQYTSRSYGPLAVCIRERRDSFRGKAAWNCPQMFQGWLLLRLFVPSGMNATSTPEHKINDGMPVCDHS